MTPYKDRLNRGDYLPNQATAPGSSWSRNIVWGEKTLAELQDAAREQLLPTYGTKAELIKRLEDANRNE